jgi:hypothetical protein
MSVVVKPGARLRSVTCTTEVVVVKGVGDLDLRCGGEPMVSADDPTEGGAPVPPYDQGTLIGKRYVSEDDTLELLCNKAGAGSLALGDVTLVLKGVKPLPASD